MKHFKHTNKKHAYFEGWYLKQQDEKNAVAFIPALHIDKHGKKSASLQIITNTQTYCIDFPAQAFHAYKNCRCVRLGNSVFSSRGCKLDIHTDTVSVKGSLRYGACTALSSDIMGPFSLVPMLQCRHSVFSLYHKVSGTLIINGKEIVFRDAAGYMEGDRGVSFPRRYLWTQCSHKKDCVMLSVADIPLGRSHFTGCIAAILADGKEYRLATYSGAKILHIDSSSIVIRQGSFILKARMLFQNALPLIAPQDGCMERTIHESLSCTVQYTCIKDGKILLHFASRHASFENAWQDH